ncbi:DNA repair protein RAD51 homolog 4 [Malaya genurostris]|uniref:DNA repair protein RAD51 homolog 4 n=1 Tax=Malaya genurostris TaxID=325434 RepID=UPI0026F3BF17|nr:DNA repair protein RAD51 homolog 4 [Malaya genurostris]
MAVTMLNAVLHPSLIPYVVKLLSKNKVITVLDFAKTDSDRLMRITNLSFEEISDIKNNLVNNYSGSNIPVIQYFRYLNERIQPISTEIIGLDLLLDGGLFPGHILEIFGEPGCGKSILCTSLAINVARNPNQHVLYCDTKNDFSTSRVHTILTQKNYNSLLIEEIMNRIEVKRIFCAEDLIEFIENMIGEIDSMDKLQVLIIDSLPALWFQYQNSKSSCYPLGMLTRLIGLLRKIASENFISIVLVNLQVRSKDSLAQNSSRRNIKPKGNATYPALGKFWETAPTTRILVNKVNDNTTGCARSISIWKSNYLQSGNHQLISITDRGAV